MEKEFEKKYHDVEQTHWWFKSRRRYLIDLLKDAPRHNKILDIGCSSGIFLKDLESVGFNVDNLFGIDISEAAVKNCKMNGIKNSYIMDAQNINLPEKFDIIIASDCLEHLKNDDEALKNWRNLLQENGIMYVFVPAFQSLWSYHDIVNMHYRRYTKKELQSKLVNNSLKIVKAGYWNCSLFLPVYIYRALFGKSKKNNLDESDLSTTNGLINIALFRLLIFEIEISRFINFPFGVSTFCIARKL